VRLSGHNLFEALWVFLIVMSSGSVFYVDEFFQFPLHIIVLCFSSVGLLLYGVKSRHAFLMCALTAVYLLFCLVQYIDDGRQSWGQAFYTISKFYIAFCVAGFISSRGYEKFAYALNSVLMFIALHSLVGWIVYPIVKNGLLDYADKIESFKHIFFYQAVGGGSLSTFNLMGFDILRNQGLMWEPSVLQFYMAVLVILRTFYFERVGIVSNIIPVLALISTWSTVGLLFLIAIFFVSSIYSGRVNVSKKYQYTILAVVFGLMLYPLLEKNVEEKFLGDRATSSTLRAIDAKVNFNAIMDKPIIGNSFDGNLYKNIILGVSNGVDAGDIDNSILERRSFETNSILVFAGQYGLVILLWSLIMLWRQTLVGGERFNKYQKVTVYVFILVECATIPIMQTNFLITIFLSKFYNR
jgi:hypothetical protein